MRKLCTMIVFSLIMLAHLSVFSGCQTAQNTNTQAKTPEQQLEFTINKVTQLQTMGKRKSDGQFVIIEINVTNPTGQAVTISPKDMVIFYDAIDKQMQYTQGMEVGMKSDFLKQFGKNEVSKLFDTNSLAVRPRFSLERYLIFMLPESASLEDYLLVYKPALTKIPLSSTMVENDDQRLPH